MNTLTEENLKKFKIFTNFTKNKINIDHAKKNFHADKDGIQTVFSQLYYEYYAGELESKDFKKVEEMMYTLEIDPKYLLKDYSLTREMLSSYLGDMISLEDKILADIIKHKGITLKKIWFDIDDLSAALIVGNTKHENYFLNSREYTYYSLNNYSGGIAWARSGNSISGKYIMPAFYL